MQLHIIGFLLLLAYLKAPRLAYLTSALLIIGGLVTVFAILAYGLAPIYLFHSFLFTKYP